MSIWNLGSVADFVYTIVEDIPSYLSGATLLELANQSVIYAEQYAGQTIGSTAIAEKFQPALIDLTAASTIEMMEIRGADVNSISLGQLSISKGQGSTVNSVSTKLRQNALDKLKALGKNVKFYKTFG